MERGAMWLAALAGAAVGACGVYFGGVAEQADAQGTKFTATPAQLRINQKISQAATRRSNRALNYLAPVRTAATDAADTGSGGVTALSAVPGAGAGWTGGQIADGAVGASEIADGAVGGPEIASGAVAGAELADGAVGEGKLTPALAGRLAAWIVKVDNNMGVPVTRASSPSISMTRLVTGTYLTDFGRNVSACSWTATPMVDSGVPAAQATRTMPDPGGDPNKVLTEVFNGPGFLVDSGVTVQVVC